MYKDSRTNVKSLCGVTVDYNVEIGVYQGSALSLYLTQNSWEKGKGDEEEEKEAVIELF